MHDACMLIVYIRAVHKRVSRTYQDLCCQGQRWLGQAAMIHQRYSSCPVTMAVKQASHSPAIHDAWESLVCLRKLDVSLQAASNAKASELQALLVLRACKECLIHCYVYTKLLVLLRNLLRGLPCTERQTRTAATFKLLQYVPASTRLRNSP